MQESLNDEQVALFRQQGFLGPFELCTPSEMRAHRSEIDRILASRGPTDRPWMFRHLDSPLIRELCSHPAIVDRVAAILGPNLVLWHSSFFEKPSGDIEIPWHQDGHFWPLDPVVNVTAWIAIDDATRDNSCLEFSPGSNRERIPHVKFAGTGRFRQKANPDYLRIVNPVHLEAKAGELLLFDAWVLHRSAANHSARRRLALSARITVPTVNIDSSRYFANYEPLRIRKADASWSNAPARPFSSTRPFNQ